MDGQRHGSGDRHRRRRPKADPPQREAPILIAARRPDAPNARPPRRLIAASAQPNNIFRPSPSLDEGRPTADCVEAAPRRAARIVQVAKTDLDERERQRQRLLDRLLLSEGRLAISRAANDYLSAGFDFPVVQDVQLQLLEHFDEGRARKAIDHLESLIENEEPIKRPLFEQRLKRLEEVAEDPTTRQCAAGLRRSIRA